MKFRKWGSGEVSIAQGTLLVVGMRWTDRAIGLLSTIILARLLVPEDFGVVAMATMAIGLAAVFLDLGVNIALIQNPNATQAHYNAAFTLRVMQTTCLALLMWFGAPLAADYFNDARVTPVLRWLALGIVIGGFENVGVITFQKEMRFGQEFKFAFLRRFMAFITVVTAAWFLRSYWALVIGTLAGKVLGVGLSYLAHPMRPRFSTQKIGEIFSVSQWVLVRGIGAYLDNNLHRILVGRRASAATLGAYTLADEISAMPSSELLAPLNRVLFPGFVRAKDQPGELKRLFLLAQGLQTLVGIPAAVGLALVAPEAVAVLLGERWMAAVPFVQLLALAGALQAITTSPGYVLITLGAVRWSAAVVWFRVALFLPLAFLLFPASGAEDLAMLRVLCMAAGLGLSILLLLRTFPEVRLREVLATVSRPILAAGAMAAALTWGLGGVALPPLVALALKVAVGALAYAAALALLWFLVGRPPGAERYLVEKVESILGRKGLAK
ncbi:lipopolysaccharide biosynthesis protein [Quisquiliibacterium transsilvanicum]|uniref:O-antigen/teichoic acid export membrane protein n=1 Tax=Quisquiliibacterium transsilvanicum TaxID=1549638 RepID=A0A7W8HDG4_9BURK|nr:lipopolysaccharide biosynthesis protein [Quisquiliibacterium transsilvanicum]MBB5270032.1 O-antigen/teichoic acid export membrane protein [Quisquiliibacterium transsilvanicum]